MAITGELHPSRDIGDIEVVSAVSGRVRLRVKDKTDTRTLDALARHLKGKRGIDGIRTNADTGSLTVRFDPAIATVSELLESIGPSTGRHPIRSPDVRDRPPTAIRSEDVETALERLKSFVPPLLGIAIVRALRIYGWTAIPAYALVAAVSREAVGQADRRRPREGNRAESDIPADRGDILNAIAQADIVIHESPGRLRLRLPHVAKNPGRAKRLRQLAAVEDGITAVRVNPANGSVTVTYPANRSPRETRARIASLLLATEMLEFPVGEPAAENAAEPKDGPPELPPSGASEPPESNGPWSRFKSSAMSVVLDWMAKTSLANP